MLYQKNFINLVITGLVEAITKRVLLLRIEWQHSINRMKKWYKNDWAFLLFLYDWNYDCSNLVITSIKIIDTIKNSPFGIIKHKSHRMNFIIRIMLNAKNVYGNVIFVEIKQLGLNIHNKRFNFDAIKQRNRMI